MVERNPNNPDLRASLLVIEVLRAFKPVSKMLSKSTLKAS
jgi:hypothetical protein